MPIFVRFYTIKPFTSKISFLLFSNLLIERFFDDFRFRRFNSNDFSLINTRDINENKSTVKLTGYWIKIVYSGGGGERDGGYGSSVIRLLRKTGFLWNSRTSSLYSCTPFCCLTICNLFKYFGSHEHQCYNLHGYCWWTVPRIKFRSWNDQRM